VVTTASGWTPRLVRREPSGLDGPVAASARVRVDEAQARAVLGWVALLAVAGFVAARMPAHDVVLYRGWAHQLLRGDLRQGLPPEYPALATVLFLLPALVPLPYHVGFAILAGAGTIGLVLASRRLAPSGVQVSSKLAVLVGLAAAWVLLRRYDVFPTLALVLAVGSALRRQWGRAWVAAALGGALQIFPAFALPVLFVAEWRQTRRVPWRRVAVLAVATAGAALAQELVAPGTVLAPVRWQLARGFEYSSVPASLTMLLDPFHLAWREGYGTHELLGAHHALIAAVVGGAEIVGLVVVLALVARGRLDVLEGTLGVLSIAVLADRSFGPQYLLWLAPLWAAVLSRRPRPSRSVTRVVLAAFALTTLTYPVGYVVGVWTHLAVLDTWVALVRNSFLIAATLAWFVGRLRSLHSLRPLRRVGGGLVLRDPSTGLVLPVVSTEEIG